MDLAQERAMRAEQIRAIRKRIAELTKKISKAREIMQDLNKCKIVIMLQAESWGTQYAAFQSVPITADIFVSDVFEGNIAETLSIEVPAAAGKMDNTASQMETLCSYIQSQIARLTEYIERLQLEIQALQASLSALI